MGSAIQVKALDDHFSWLLFEMQNTCSSHQVFVWWLVWVLLRISSTTELFNWKIEYERVLSYRQMTVNSIVRGTNVYFNLNVIISYHFFRYFSQANFQCEIVKTFKTNVMVYAFVAFLFSHHNEKFYHSNCCLRQPKC